MTQELVNSPWEQPWALNHHTDRKAAQEIEPTTWILSNPNNKICSLMLTQDWESKVWKGESPRLPRISYAETKVWGAKNSVMSQPMLFRHRPSARLLVVDYTGNQQTPLFTHTLFWGTGMQGTTAVPWYIFRMPDDIFAWQILCFTICFKPVQLSHSMLASSGQATLYPWAFDLYVGFFFSGKRPIQKII